MCSFRENVMLIDVSGKNNVLTGASSKNQAANRFTAKSKKHSCDWIIINQTTCGRLLFRGAVDIRPSLCDISPWAWSVHGCTSCMFKQC